MAQRLVRAKRKIADARHPLPGAAGRRAARPARGVLAVVYLIFNEGYARRRGDALVRGELCDEAIRLGGCCAELMPDDAEALRAAGADAAARRAPRGARRRADGRLRRCSTSRTARAGTGADRTRASGARRAPRRSAAGPVPAAGGDRRRSTSQAPTAERDRLGADRRAVRAARARSRPSPVVELNRAVAVAMAAGPRGGPGAARAAARRSDARAATSRCTPPRAELLPPRRRHGGARAAYERAMELSENAVERAELGRRLAALG